MRGYLAIIWGAFLLRVRVRRPKVDTLEFFTYRRDWNLDIKRAFGFDVSSQGPRPLAGTLVVSNHFGFADINSLICECPAESMLNFVSKIEVGELPIFGWHMRPYGDVLFDRKNPEARKAVVDEALARIRRGFSVVLFPEGTRSKTGTPKAEVRPALIEAAIRARVPIQPVGVNGTLNLIEDIRAPKNGQRIRLRFGQARTTFKDATEVWAEVQALWREAAADTASTTELDRRRAAI